MGVTARVASNMTRVRELTSEQVTQNLAYAGLILVTFELVRSLIIKPIKFLYQNVRFGAGMPFKSYELDVISRHRNEFEACLLYLRDFMKAIDSEDVRAIQGLRKHRNELAHDLPSRLIDLRIEEYAGLLGNARRALFKLSNHHTYIEIGSDPKFEDIGIDWDSVKGHEYLLFEDLMSKIEILQGRLK